VSASVGVPSGGRRGLTTGSVRVLLLSLVALAGMGFGIGTLAGGTTRARSTSGETGGGLAASLPETDSPPTTVPQSAEAVVPQFRGRSKQTVTHNQSIPRAAGAAPAPTSGSGASISPGASTPTLGGGGSTGSSSGGTGAGGGTHTSGGGLHKSSGGE
jgi:hypothetical protein